ncbi:DUF5028 domain-containing protein [Lachnobacterium bovis]|uniref:DUF5028 domain-containing protein n=1 Tax=Lachnobacterium bovis TaxID=140626 RepID=UPI000487893D|nr:DUF5028 domain-containing protein [Lachnobacterium bovis]
MSKNKIRKILLIASVIIVASVIYCYRFKAANQKIKNPRILNYKLGETVKMNDDILLSYTMKGYSIKVKKTDVLNYKEYLKKYRLKDEYTVVPDKVYDVKVEIENYNADKGTGINLAEFYIQKSSAIAGIDVNLLGAVNKNLKGQTSIALRKNSKIQINIPFDLYKYSFNDSTWKNIKNYDMKFVVTLYPTKKVVDLR